MFTPQPLRTIHFIGICGTAMASVAAALKDRGVEVSGSDSNVYPPMSTFLEERGIRIMKGYEASNLQGCQPDLVVVGNAISRGNPELEFMMDQKMRFLSLPEVLKDFFLRGKQNLVVSGTHGKTTTTSLLAWILKVAGLDPSYLIGGIPKNLGQGACFTDSPHVVLEGDEYDTAFFDKRSKFLHYLPELVIINNIEFDHADIYENLDAIKLSFRRLVNIVPRNGLIVANGDDKNVLDVIRSAITPVLKVGEGAACDVRIEGIRQEGARSQFMLQGNPYEVSLLGNFNVRNAAVAICAARHLKISDEKVREALLSFEGVKRRQEVRAVAGGVTIIDDFGHHPTAIRETLTALRVRFPGARLWAFFEPRSNTTRRAICQKELPEALSLADGVFVSQVARLEQIPADQRLDPERVMADIRSKGKEAHYMDSVPAIVSQAARTLREGDVAVVFSNGSFDQIHEKLIKALGARSS
jgi:UDP-N-acetylmuramate: L-alanyl-gamma-D-glutamyl-meso-diaminopimelate ligase